MMENKENAAEFIKLIDEIVSDPHFLEDCI